ncbi:MAG TPA: methylenetetrahydrofolate reductase [Pseudolabrys sp.]|jgi:methylenetetrahydrofolate reductase (NADPH)
MAAGFTKNFSIEVTRPNTAEIATLAGILPPATSVYFSAVPTFGPAELVTAAAALRRGGLEPVIHVAARRTPTVADLKGLLSRLRDEADVRKLLVIGGDTDTQGTFADALAVIQKGGLREAGIEEIGIGAYPEGHPRIPPERLSASLDEKIAAARAQGLRVHLVSQFSFSGEQIIAWLKQLRANGITLPVKVGMAGPTSLPALLRYAKRCGVNASMRGLASGVATSLIGHVGPDHILEVLKSAPSDLGDVHPHYFSFGGPIDTARYASAAAETASAAV